MSLTYEHNATRSREVTPRTSSCKELHVSEHSYTAGAFNLLVEKGTDWVTRGRTNILCIIYRERQVVFMRNED